MDALESPARPALPVTRPVLSPILHRSEIVVIFVAPVVLTLGRLLLVPYNDQEWSQVLDDMAANHSRNALGWSLALLAAALLTIAGLALVRMVPDRRRLTVPAMIGVAIGWTGTAAIASGGLVMGDLANSTERSSMVEALTNFNEGNGNTIFFFVLGGVIGNILLGVALARSGVASRGTAVLFAVGAIVSLVGAPGPVKAIAVSGAVLLIVAHLMIVRKLVGRAADQPLPQR